MGRYTRGVDVRLAGNRCQRPATTSERPSSLLAALDEHGIPYEWILGVDPEKLDVVLVVTDLSEEDVYDADEQVYVQKTGVNESEKFSRLQGLADRLDEVEGGEGLHDDLADLERRLDEALSAG
jgi:hypothetical protein